MALSFWGIMAQAHWIERASYHRDSQSLSLLVAYQGARFPHQFSLIWDACQSLGGRNQVAARLVADDDADDIGTQEFQQLVNFDLSGLQCKPAELTIFSGRRSRQTLWIH